MKVAWQIAVLAIVYAVVARLCLLVQLPGTQATAVWLPSGIAFASLYVGGLRLWPGVWLGALLANTWISVHSGNAGNLALATAALIACGNMAEGVMLARFAGHPLRVKSFVPVILAACAVAAISGPLTLWTFGVLQGEHVWLVGATWFAGDVGGVLAVIPYLLWRQHGR